MAGRVCVQGSLACFGYLSSSAWCSCQVSSSSRRESERKSKNPKKDSQRFRHNQLETLTRSLAGSKRCRTEPRRQMSIASGTRTVFGAFRFPVDSRRFSSAMTSWGDTLHRKKPDSVRALTVRGSRLSDFVSRLGAGGKKQICDFLGNAQRNGSESHTLGSMRS